MSQNNMISFVTLTEIDGTATEINPAAIIMMQRVIHDGMPYTKLTLSFNTAITVSQTPEQIAELQMESVSKVMESVMRVTANIVNNMEDEF